MSDQIDVSTRNRRKITALERRIADLEQQLADQQAQHEVEKAHLISALNGMAALSQHRIAARDEAVAYTAGVEVEADC